MLSYQHIYHAGNLADVHKHALLACVLDYLVKKPKPLHYFESHAGRGLYDLASVQAQKTGEADVGIIRALQEKWFKPDHPYMKVIKAHRLVNGNNSYPGSPLVATHFLREDDMVHLNELHPQEFAALKKAFKNSKASVKQLDGLKQAIPFTPPTPQRGMMVIDPSYEIKSEYDEIPAFIKHIHKRWKVGLLFLWYPILDDDRHLEMTAAIGASDLPGFYKSEVRFPSLRKGHRLVGSGVIMVNAPFGIDETAADIEKLYKSPH